MATVLRRGALVPLLLCLSIGMASAQAGAGESPGFGFTMALGIGVQTFNEPGPVTYQSISLAPDFSYGKLGVGLDLTLNFTGFGQLVCNSPGRLGSHGLPELPPDLPRKDQLHQVGVEGRSSFPEARLLQCRDPRRRLHHGGLYEHVFPSPRQALRLRGRR